MMLLIIEVTYISPVKGITSRVLGPVINFTEGHELSSIAPSMENQMEGKMEEMMEKEMETGST